MSNEHANKIKEAMEHIKKGCNVLFGGPMSYYLEKNTAIVEEFFKRCSPFRMGDVVEVTVDIDFEEAFGWAGYKDSLQKGCRAEVIGDIDFRDGKFFCLVKALSGPGVGHNFVFSEVMCATVEGKRANLMGDLKYLVEKWGG